MRKVLVGFLISTTFLALPNATAATPVVRIVDQPHINFDGTFRDNELATSLLPNGALGKIVYTAPSSDVTWVIDPALIDEITTMAKGYEIEGKKDEAGQNAAKSWLLRLSYATLRKTVVALPYGNPDQKLLKKIAPNELKFYSQFGADLLSQALNRPVVTENGWGKGSSALTYEQRSRYLHQRKVLASLSTISGAPEITNLRARISLTLSPLLNRKERAYFSHAAAKAVSSTSDKLRVIGGRYQLTSNNVKLPITVINNFETAAVVNVSLIPQNSRIQVANVNAVTLAPRSRQQLTIPVTVIAPGTTLVIAQLMNQKGQLVGESSKLNLSATIIDSRVTWFTTGAAIVLFLGAVAQSVRRVKRSRHEK